MRQTYLWLLQLAAGVLVARALGLIKKQLPSPPVPPPTESKPKIPFPEFNITSSGDP